MSDHRSPEAQAYRHLYGLAAWKRARTAQLHRHPLCEKCQHQGLITPATIVNHRKPHRGDMELFLDPKNHESTCKPHHDGAIQAFEKSGIERGCDANGTPNARPGWGAGKIFGASERCTANGPSREENPKNRVSQ